MYIPPIKPRPVFVRCILWWSMVMKGLGMDAIRRRSESGGVKVKEDMKGRTSGFLSGIGTDCVKLREMKAMTG